MRIGRPDGTKYVDTDALVDTGATLTVIPRSLASELDLQVTGRTYVETAAGRIEQDKSRALIEIEGRSEIVPVLVSDVVDRSNDARGTGAQGGSRDGEACGVDYTHVLNVLIVLQN